MSTKRIKLVVAYDGTDFCGWAAQPGLRTVQGTLKEAVRQVSGEDCEITGASRTDGGAHALGQVCHFDTSVAIEPGTWARALNKVMSADVAVQKSSRVANRFHSRFSVDWRNYRYRIRTATRDPLETRYVHDYGRPLEIDAMVEAAKIIVGDHDFRAFSEELPEGILNTVRRLFEVKVIRKPTEIWIDIRGTAFMKGMMRRISGGLFEVGRGYRTIKDFEALLNPAIRDSVNWPVVLPAKGLTLLEIRYSRPLRDIRELEDTAD